VFSFGLGDDCDKWLVRNVARAGRGTATLVRDNDPTLNGKVIRALSNAMEPSLFQAEFGFNGDLSPPTELYRNTLVFTSKLMPIHEFESVRF